MRCPCRPHRTGLKSNRRSDLSLSADAAGARRASVTTATRATRARHRSLPLSRCATAPPRGEQLDRTARALRAAVAASIGSSPPLPAASPPRSGGGRGNGDYAQVSSGGAVGSDCSRAACGGRCFDRQQPPSACGISPRGAGGEGKWRLRAGLLGGSSWIGLLARSLRRSLLRSAAAPLCLRHLPPQSGGRGEMEITRRSPRGEQLDRTARALRAAVAASIVSSPPLPSASPPASRGESHTERS